MALLNEYVNIRYSGFCSILVLVMVVVVSIGSAAAYKELVTNSTKVETYSIFSAGRVLCFTLSTLPLALYALLLLFLEETALGLQLLLKLWCAKVINIKYQGVLHGLENVRTTTYGQCTYSDDLCFDVLIRPPIESHELNCEVIWQFGNARRKCVFCLSA